uniref:Uncharacterized protein n=1 Tax=Salix viminalis TaxID=40686 RepID=A0A6N2MWT3_SALVM
MERGVAGALLSSLILPLRLKREKPESGFAREEEKEWVDREWVRLGVVEDGGAGLFARHNDHRRIKKKSVAQRRACVHFMILSSFKLGCFVHLRQRFLASDLSYVTTASLPQASINPSLLLLLSPVARGNNFRPPALS